MKTNDNIRNIAIIAHVDHGKTTLVDGLFRQSGLFREGQVTEERIMDRLDLERERGITIAAKNCSVMWNNTKINIIDTPGHADFGGEVERALSMADGAVLLVDASEGPLPQTRFVLLKAFEGELPIIVVINKIDRQDARSHEVLDEIYDMFIDLGATDEQIDFPVFFAIGRDGVIRKNLNDPDGGLDILLDAILEEIPAPAYHSDVEFQMRVADLGYSDYLGRLAIGRVYNGRAKANQRLSYIDGSGEPKPMKVTKLQTYMGPAQVETDSAEPGDIIVLSGTDDIKIGDTICAENRPAALRRITVDEPTVYMQFGINSSPLCGRDGKYVQSRHIRERLMKETLMNVAVQVEETDDQDSFLVKGRGEFQMAILIETMRRQGYELSVGRPKVIYKYENGRKLEPVENLIVDCREDFLGIVTEKLSIRKGKMTKMFNNGSGRVRMEFSVPSRALIGYRDEFLTDTKGMGIMNSIFDGYAPFRGEFTSRVSGSIVSDRQGTSVAYALYNLEPRGRLFIEPNESVYEGMIVGEHNRKNDITANPCKTKKLTNIRAAGKDDAVVCTPIRPVTVEWAVNFIKDDEMAEITPNHIRLRKTVLSGQKRHAMRSEKNKAT